MSWEEVANIREVVNRVVLNEKFDTNFTCLFRDGYDVSVIQLQIVKGGISRKSLLYN